MPIKIVRSGEDLSSLRAAVLAATDRMQDSLRDVCALDPLDALVRLKFSEAGWDPLDDRSLNLIEQVNQTFTYLVSFTAVEAIGHRHPDAWPIQLNLGAAGGSDVESPTASVAAEVFAAVRATNNRKLTKDIAKVAGTAAKHKYVFYYCPGKACIPAPSLRNPLVQVVALTEEQVIGPLRRGV